MDRKTVSVCMICFNESDCLHTSLKSAQKLADEIIVVDNGSTDDSVEVAGKYGARVIKWEDRSSKSRLRNIAISNASSDWVVILDGDEEIAEPEVVKEYLRTADDEAIYVRIVAPSNGFAFHQMRIWPKGTYKYKYRSHELPVHLGDPLKTKYSDIVFNHYQPSYRWPMKLETTLARLILDVHENPGDARPLYYLGRQYLYLRMYESAIATFEEYFKCEQNRYDDADAYANMATCYKQLGDNKKAKTNWFEAISTFPNRREFWVGLAEQFRNDKNYNLAISMLQCAERVPPPKTRYYVAHWYDDQPHLSELISRNMWSAGRYEEGLKYALKALAIWPDNKQLIENVRFFKEKVYGDNAGNDKNKEE